MEITAGSVVFVSDDGEQGVEDLDYEEDVLETLQERKWAVKRHEEARRNDRTPCGYAVRGSGLGSGRDSEELNPDLYSLVEDLCHAVSNLRSQVRQMNRELERLRQEAC